MTRLRHMIRCHLWFVRESRSYAGGWNRRTLRQYPAAWFRFMRYSWGDSR